MICKRCNNQMVWVGSMHGGGLTCEHCANDDSLTEALYRDAEGYGAGVAIAGTTVVVAQGMLRRAKVDIPVPDPGCGGCGGSGVGSGPDGDMNYMDYDI